MINSNALPWIQAGYEIFALEGPKALKIEILARKVGISKSSFYHHFADLDVFMEMLLEYHLETGSEIAIKARQCKVMVPDCLVLMAEYKLDHLFNRQLRNYRDNYSYQLCFERATDMVLDEFIGIWAEMHGLTNHPQIARSVLKVVTEIFYSRITPETLSYEWMVMFLDEVNDFIQGVIKSSGVSSQLRSEKHGQETV